MVWRLHFIRFEIVTMLSTFSLISAKGWRFWRPFWSVYVDWRPFFSGFEVFYGECWRCVGILSSILADANRILQILSSFWVILAKRWWFWRDLLSILISFYRFVVIFWVWRCFYGECWRCVGIWWSILVDLNRTLQILSSFWVIWANDWRFRWIFVELFNRFRCF